LVGQGWKNFSEIDNILTVWKNEYSDTFLPKPEEARISIKYVIPSADGEPIGRLHVNITPAYSRRNDEKLFVFNLIARITPKGDDTSAILKTFDLAREWIVRGFSSITTPTMHKIWERFR
jgi:hypothetical protein